MNLGDAGNSNQKSGVLDQLDSFVVAAKQLETALNHERESSRKMRGELHEQQLRNERQTKENEAQIRELTHRGAKLQSALKEYQENEKKLVSRAQALTSELKKIRDELGQYRAAWSDVLQREREAKLILQESEEGRRRMTELEVTLKGLHQALASEKSKREQAERHSNTYQLELKNALIRLHSAEVKFNELNKELIAFRGAKRNLDEEIAKIERDLRERLNLEALKDREKTRAELEREMALDREKYREQAREQIRLELDRGHVLEREQFHRIREHLENEICSLRLTLDQAREESELLRVESANRLRNSQETARAELEAVRSDLHQRLAHAQETAKNENEAIRRELNTKLLELQVRCGELEAETRSAEALVTTLRKDEAAARTYASKVEVLEAENSSLRKLGVEISVELEELRARTGKLQTERNGLKERCQSLEMSLLGSREKFEQGLERLNAETQQALREHPFRTELTRIQDQIEVLSARLSSGVERLKPRDRARLLTRLSDCYDEKARLEARQAEALSHLKSHQKKVAEASVTQVILAEPTIQ